MDAKTVIRAVTLLDAICLWSLASANLPSSAHAASTWVVSYSSPAGRAKAKGATTRGHNRQTARDREVVHLVNQISRLEAWNDTDYSPEGWAALKRVARLVQKTDPQIVELALKKFTFAPDRTRRDPEHGNREIVEVTQTKTFLLLRVVFDLPEDAPRNEWVMFVRWVYMYDGGFHWEPPAGERVNLAFPISWNGGSPKLQAECWGAQGSAYRADREYHYMLKHFNYRNLGTVNHRAGDPKPTDLPGSEAVKR